MQGTIGSTGTSMLRVRITTPQSEKTNKETIYCNGLVWKQVYLIGDLLVISILTYNNPPHVFIR